LWLALRGVPSALYISFTFFFVFWAVYFDPLDRQVDRPRFTIFFHIKAPWARDSPSSALPDVIQTNVLLPRPLDDNVLLIVCLRSVATNQVN